MSTPWQGSAARDGAAFIAMRSRWRIAGLIALALAFVALGLALAGVFGPLPGSSSDDGTERAVIGWVTIVFFGLCAVAGMKQLFRTGPFLRIDAQGITMAALDQRIAWNNIADVTTWQYRRQKSIILHLRDADAVRRRGIMARLLASTNRAVTGGDISISLGTTDRTMAEALDAIARFRA